MWWGLKDWIGGKGTWGVWDEEGVGGFDVRP